MKRAAVFFAILVWAAAFVPAALPASDDFTASVEMLDGGKVGLEEYVGGFKGKVVVFNFWATWCPICGHEMKNLEAFYNDYRSKGVEVVGISVDDGGREVVRPYLEKKKISYPMVIGNDAVVDAFGGIPGVPVSFVIDRDGKVVRRLLGAQGRKGYERAVEKFL